MQTVYWHPLELLKWTQALILVWDSRAHLQLFLFFMSTDTKIAASIFLYSVSQLLVWNVDLCCHWRGGPVSDAFTHCDATLPCSTYAPVLIQGRQWKKRRTFVLSSFFVYFFSSKDTSNSGRKWKLYFFSQTNRTKPQNTSPSTTKGRKGHTLAGGKVM